MTLHDYSKKRHFDQTPEPAGRVAADPGGAHRRFVVQEHHASQLHYDFRLEIGSVLKSWAIPKGPSLDPEVKRLAVEVEDHPLDYAEFQGVIPPGNYGAGEVFRWDYGTYTLREPDAEEAWKAGSLHLTLRGKKLRGEWRLFRTKKGNRPHWLLQKADDGYAQAEQKSSSIGRVPHKPAPPLRRTLPPTSADAISVEGFLARRILRGNLTLEIEGTPLRLTSLDRVYWPADGITKGDLLKYYLKVAPSIMPLLAGRPAILKRFPNGIGQASFHQHDLQAAPEFLRIYADVDQERSIHYAVYTGCASLLYLANLGSIEQHPWHARVDRIPHPDWTVIDLDPHSTRWDDIVLAALEVRNGVTAMGLTPFLKTSGSRGLHIYIPLKPDYTPEQASDAAEAVCRVVNERLPEITTVERRMEARKTGQIYLDWMQNARGKTVASAYSVRAREGATVSCPITWEELESGARIDDFNINTVPERLQANDDPWSEFFEHASAIPAARKLKATDGRKRSGGQ